jgi:hypothetical protein
MALFGRDKPKPVKPEPAVDDNGFVNHREPTYHCACGFATKSSRAMDGHVARAHPNG